MNKSWVLGFVTGLNVAIIIINVIHIISMR